MLVLFLILKCMYHLVVSICFYMIICTCLCVLTDEFIYICRSKLKSYKALLSRIPTWIKGPLLIIMWWSPCGQYLKFLRCAFMIHVFRPDSVVFYVNVILVLVAEVYNLFPQLQGASLHYSFFSLHGFRKDLSLILKKEKRPL